MGLIHIPGVQPGVQPNDLKFFFEEIHRLAGVAHL